VRLGSCHCKKASRPGKEDRKLLGAELLSLLNRTHLSFYALYRREVASAAEAVRWLEQANLTAVLVAAGRAHEPSDDATASDVLATVFR